MWDVVEGAIQESQNMLTVEMVVESPTAPVATAGITLAVRNE